MLRRSSRRSAPYTPGPRPRKRMPSGIKGVDFVSLGQVVLENIEYRFKPRFLKCLGGPGIWATFGARLFSNGERSRDIGFMISTPETNSEEIARLLQNWDIQLFRCAAREGECARATIKYESKFTGKRKYKEYREGLHPEIWDIYTINELVCARSFHICALPQEFIKWLRELKAVRDLDGVKQRPLIVWELPPAIYRHDELKHFMIALRHVDVFSPSPKDLVRIYWAIEKEKQRLRDGASPFSNSPTSFDPPDPSDFVDSDSDSSNSSDSTVRPPSSTSSTETIVPSHPTTTTTTRTRRSEPPYSAAKRRRRCAFALDRALDVQFSRQRITRQQIEHAARVVLHDACCIGSALVVRCGRHGAYWLESCGRGVGHWERWRQRGGWVGTYWNSQTSKRIGDLTGAGHAFLGAMTLALAQNHTMTDACLRGTIAASFAIEQYGLSILRKEEPWGAWLEHPERRWPHKKASDIESWNGDDPWRRLNELARKQLELSELGHDLPNFQDHFWEL